MHRDYQRWYSPTLNRDMELLVLGHGGARVLVFPTSQGRFFEWEDRDMGGALAEHLERGWLQLFCVDSVDAESWYDRATWPGDRAWRHEQYDRYLLHEVLPFTRHRNPNPFLIATGASLGAYHAVNFAFRHPEVVNRVIGMSGHVQHQGTDARLQRRQRARPRPVAVHAARAGAGPAGALRRMDIILAIGRDDPHYFDNVHLSERAVAPGHLARVPAVGRLGARLAVVARHDPPLHRWQRLRRLGMGERRVGLLVGREWSFPPAFIEEVRRRDEGVVAEYVSLGGTAMDEPVPYDVIIDRISHEVPYYRSWLKHAVLEGATVVNNPFMWTADDKFFGASLATKLGIAHPKTLALPNREYVPGIKHDESLRNLAYPLDWDDILHYIGLPCILKDAHGGGWKEVYVCRTKEKCSTTTMSRACSR
jgi:esterase/lipase superfamily enzyme